MTNERGSATGQLQQNQGDDTKLAGTSYFPTTAPAEPTVAPVTHSVTERTCQWSTKHYRSDEGCRQVLTTQFSMPKD